MKSYSYIERVLSHIKSKQGRESVRVELFDHIDERNNFYLDIGFDEESAYEKAELAMGDADIVGEQLDLQVRHKSNSLLIIFDVLLILSSALLDFFDFIITDVDAAIFGFSYFYELIFTTVIIVLAFCCLVLSTKYKRPLSAIISFLFSFYHSIVLAEIIGGVASDILKGNIATLGFFRGFFNNGSLKTIFVIAFIIIFAASIFNCLIVYIKTKRLENTLYDIKKNNVITAVLIVNIIVIIAFTTATSVNVISYKNKALDDTIKLSENLTSAFIKNANSFVTDDRDLFYKADKSAFGDACNCDHIYKENFDFDNFYPVDCDFDEIIGEATITISQPFSNPFSFRNDDYKSYLHKLTADEVYKNMALSDVPLPADMEFNYSNEKNTLYFNYSNNAYILFTYNYSEKRFELTDSSVFTYNNSITLSSTQIKQLDSAILSNLDIDNMQLVTNIYDISRDDNCSANNIYKINLAYLTYKKVNDNGKLKYIERYLNEAVCIIARIDGDEVNIITLDDLSDDEIKAEFTADGYKNYQQRNTEWYNN